MVNLLVDLLFLNLAQPFFVLFQYLFTERVKYVNLRQFLYRSFFAGCFLFNVGYFNIGVTIERCLIYDR